MITPTTGEGAGSPAPPVIAPGYEVVTMTIPSGSYWNSGECSPGAIVVGHHPVGDVDKTIDTIRVSAGSIEVKLTGKSEQDNIFNVILLKPVEDIPEPAEETQETD